MDSKLICNIILDIIYGSFAILCLFELVRLQMFSQPKKITKPKLAYGLIILCCLTRISIDIIPDDYYNHNVDNHPTLQMWLDLLPELMFYALYFLLLVMWVEIYYLMKLKEPSIIKQAWIGFGVIVGLEFSAGLIFSISIGETGPYSENNLQKETIFLATLSLLLMVAFPLGSFYFIRKLSAAPITSLSKRGMVSQLQKTLILCIICSLTKTVYTLSLEIYFKGIIQNTVGRSLVFMLYFVFTEQLPTGLILFMLHKMTEEKVTKHKKKVRIAGKTLQPLLGQIKETSLEEEKLDVDPLHGQDL